MSTATTPAAGTRPATLDISGTKPVSLLTLTKVELRKMYDTRAGLWLLITIAAITLIVLTIFWFAADQNERTIFSMLGIMASPQGMLLPVLGILLITQEWGQRTGMVTFTLEPNRGKVIMAKILAATVFGIAAVVLALVLGCLGAALGGAPDAFTGFDVDYVLKILMMQVLGVLIGIGFGLAFLNSPAAIVLYFVLPTAIAIVTNLVSWLRDVAPWIDGRAAEPIYSGADLTGQDWAQLATYTAVWMLLPMAIGLWRVMRAEVK